ncbi:hypothetical protein Htur_5193 (plasmid) [Haloterrigena turkmenica DSM 5511]|uniref:Uncharacterized protein n=1 Tax=Haloterrigena turkmenica (strain ATCC 51198 / DSM 5511 / JCM 9101 / NCIMB 13204 / VKM B-1734 / 4k) TaxID=543526 RepID=D2S377_HALTV|nr:hypothetical protein [Haloterrigena turkmenica]ADB63824.1 hypothetical protein Htur_5193 [Haloterrigena turkmenica DSM 5511]
MRTYRLELRETGTNGIDADVYADDVIEESTRVAYENHDLEPPESRDEGPSYTEEVTADVTTLNLQYERDDGASSSGYWAIETN